MRIKPIHGEKIIERDFLCTELFWLTNITIAKKAVPVPHQTRQGKKLGIPKSLSRYPFLSITI